MELHEEKVSENFQDINELQDEIVKIWLDMSISFINKLYNSLQDRMKFLIISKGKQIKY